MTRKVQRLKWKGVYEQRMGIFWSGLCKCVKFFSQPSTNKQQYSQYTTMASSRNCYRQGWMIKNSRMHRLIVARKLNRTNWGTKKNYLISLVPSFAVPRRAMQLYRKQMYAYKTVSLWHVQLWFSNSTCNNTHSKLLFKLYPIYDWGEQKLIGIILHGVLIMYTWYCVRYQNIIKMYTNAVVCEYGCGGCWRKWWLELK